MVQLLRNNEPVLGVLLRCHRRARTLDIALREFLRYGRLRRNRIHVRIHVMADRPTKEVQAVLEQYESVLYAVKLAPYPLLSKEHGELFMPALNLQLEDLEKVNVDWYMVADDDHWFEPHHIDTELYSALRSVSVDLWFAHCIFFRDSPTTYDKERGHFSPVFFRAMKGDRFPLHRMIMATEQIHDTAIIQNRTAILKTPILDYGIYSAEERMLTYAEYKKAGKIDPFTQSGADPSRVLANFPEDAVAAGLIPDTTWIDLWSKYNGSSHSESHLIPSPRDSAIGPK